MKMEITLKRAGIIYVIVVIAVAGIFYASLSSQDEFIRDNRWLSDKSSLSTLVTQECTTVFTYKNEDTTVRLPTNYKIGNHIISEPLEDEAAFDEAIQPFIQAIQSSQATQQDLEEWQQQIFQDYRYDELQYTAALSNIELELTIEETRVINPNIPPIVVSTDTVQKTVRTISVMYGNVWHTEMMIVVEEDGSYSVPPIALERYLGIETDVEDI